MQDDGEGDDGEDDMYELDEEQYQQLIEQMQANEQNMLMEDGQNLNAEQIQQLRAMQAMYDDEQDYGEEAYDEEEMMEEEDDQM